MSFLFFNPIWTQVYKTSVCAATHFSFNGNSCVFIEWTNEKAEVVNLLWKQHVRECKITASNETGEAMWGGPSGATDSPSQNEERGRREEAEDRKNNTQPTNNQTAE